MSVLGKQMEIIAIPDHDWQELRADFIQNQEKSNPEKTKEQPDPVVDEAKKLFGDDLVEIHD